MDYESLPVIDNLNLDDESARILRELKCAICASHASGFHFDAQSCSACAAFFRRTVVLDKAYQCQSKETPYACKVHYQEPKSCRACRFSKCLKAGMDKNSVQPQKTKEQKQRSYFTKSGLKRNKRFAVQEVRVALDRKICVQSPSSTISPPLSVAIPSPEGALTHASSVPSPETAAWAPIGYSTPSTSSPVDSNSPKFNFDGSYNHHHQQLQHPQPLQNQYIQQQQYYYQQNVLASLVNEELNLAEKRRLVFRNCDAKNIFESGHNAYSIDDIKPLSFKAYRESIRTHILFVRDWLRAWPEFQYLRTEDQMTFLRKCVLYHIVIDPVMLTMQIGDNSKFVMQNGGYVSTTELSNDGWEDEEEITGATKKAIYWPLLHRVLNEILRPIANIGLFYEEIVALKAFVCYRGTYGDIHKSGHDIINSRTDQLQNALYRFYDEKHIPRDRIGQVILLTSSVLEVSHDFVLGHHQIEFFKLWGLDSLLVQMLHHYGRH